VKLKKDFQRTASRLVEMQAEAYLARAHKPQGRMRNRASF
jgi:predicted ATPase